MTFQFFCYFTAKREEFQQINTELPKSIGYFLFLDEIDFVINVKTSRRFDPSEVIFQVRVEIYYISIKMVLFLTW